MEITIKTRFNIGDTVYGCYGHCLQKFRVNNITVHQSTNADKPRIEYDCTAVIPKNYELTFGETFEESELMVKGDIVKSLENLVKEEGYEN